MVMAGKVRKKSKALIRKQLVSRFMTRKIVSLAIDYDLEKVYNIFIENKISGAPVFSKGFFIGELSRTDILRFLKKKSMGEVDEKDKSILMKHTAIELMKRPICIFVSSNINEARRKMKRYKIKRLFVIDKRNRLEGIITETDLITKGAAKDEKKITIEKTLHTQLDDMLNILEKGPADLKKLSKEMKTPQTMVEHWGKTLEEHGMVEISYPVVGSPVIRLKKIKEK
jgi:CBS domain-containing protein